jgi:hypothetical protein
VSLTTEFDLSYNDPENPSEAANPEPFAQLINGRAMGA